MEPESDAGVMRGRDDPATCFVRAEASCAHGTVHEGRGILTALEGRLEEARTELLDSPLLPEEGLRSALFHDAWLAAIEAALGHVDVAKERAARVVHATSVYDPELFASARAVESFVGIAAAAVASARGESEAASRGLDAAVGWWRSRDRMRDGGQTAGLTQRLLDGLTPRIVVGPPWQSAPSDRPVPIGPLVDVAVAAEARPWTRALRIAEDASRFRLHDRTVDLSSRAALRSFLAVLVRERCRAPGAVVDHETLGATGPGARARVHTTIRRLRQIGLREVIVEHGGRYAIDPSLAIVLVREWSARRFAP